MSFLWLPPALRRSALSSGEFVPTQVSAVSSWLRLSQATVTGSGYSSVPDTLGGAPAVQATDARRPVNATAANGLPIANFTDDLLEHPLANTTNGTSPGAGFALWVRCTPDGTVRRILSVRIPGAGGGASDNRIELESDTNAARGLFVDVYNSTVTGRRGATQAALPAAAWTFITWEFDGTQSTDALKCLLTVNGVVQTLSFSDFTGAPGAMPSTLATVTGNLHIGALTAAGGNPFVGSVGPNIYFLNRQLTAGERAQLMAFEAPT